MIQIKDIDFYEDELTIEESRFIEYILQGFTKQDAWRLSHPKVQKGKASDCANALFNKGRVREAFEKRKKEIEAELQDRTIWSRERATEELIEILIENKKEMKNYNEAYITEINLIDKKIIKLLDEIEKGNLSKKRKEELEEQIEALEYQKIKTNRKHQQSRAVNEALLQSIQQLNNMMGLDRPKDKVDTNIKISFDDSLTVD